MNKGWEKKKLGDVCEIITRGISPIYIVENGVMVLNQKCIRNHKINYELSRIHNNKIKTVKDERLLKAGDVLVNSTGTGTLGRVAQVEEDVKATVDSHITIVRPTKDLFYNKFFGYAMINIEEAISRGGEGCGGQTELSRTKLKDDYWIAFPKSINEQKDIVNTLNQAFDALEQAKIVTKQNLNNTTELFESYLQNIFVNPSEDWEEKKLGELTFVKSGGTPSRAKKEYWVGNIAWYSSGELNNLYTENPERYINQLAVQNSNAKLFPKGSLLIGMYDTAALKMSILDRDATFNQAIAGVKPNGEINMQFILHAINAIKPELLKLRRGVRQKNLSLEKIKNISIIFPNTNKQKAIVDNLTDFSNKTKKLQHVYLKKLTLIEELKKTLLHKAFSGELNLSTEKITA